MKVVLPRPASGTEIAEAFAKASTKLNLSYNLNTQFSLVPGSVKKQPYRYTPKASRHLRGLFGKFVVQIGEADHRLRWKGIKADTNYFDSIEVVCEAPGWMLFARKQLIVTETDDRLYKKIEPHLEAFLEEFFSALKAPATTAP